MRSFARLLLIASLVVFTTSMARAQTVAWTQAVDDAIRDAVAAADVPGAVLLVGQGDQVLHRKVLGWRATVPAPELSP